MCTDKEHAEDCVKFFSNDSNIERGYLLKEDVDEKSWSNQDFCRKKKVYADPVKILSFFFPFL
jgi:hypothetical protein